MNSEELIKLKEEVCRTIASKRSEIIDLGEDIFRHPELGYKETRTSEVMLSKLTSLGLKVEQGLALTGLKAVASGCSSKARVCVMGELDAVVSPQHPSCDPSTGAAHACGHHGQLASMFGAAIGLISSGVIDKLDGDVVFLAVPAEEFVELGYRREIREQGKIRFFGGKQEFIKDGVFDDIDAAIMVHAEAQTPGRKAFIGASCNGFIGKIATYLGRAAHAGAAPHEGINALNAAVIGMTAINAQRETFQDNDSIRVHPIITKGGDLVNIVPDEVVVETYVRGRTMSSIFNANDKVNRALKAGAYAVGGECEIEEIPGYLPLNQDNNLSELFAANMSKLIGAENVVPGPHVPASTDIGDVSQIIPAIQPSVGGYSGVAHGRDFCVTDPDMAYIYPAQAIAMTVVDLLFDGAQNALAIKDSFKASLDRESYLKMWDNFMSGK